MEKKMKVQDAIRIASKYYDKKKMKHAVRVADYAEEICRYDVRYQMYGTSTAYAVGLLHDIVEDTDCTLDDLVETGYPTYIVEAIDALTKKEEEDYGEYIDRLISSGSKLAYLVKKADMKDHMAETNTLTDKLKEKYFPHIAKFM